MQTPIVPTTFLMTFFINRINKTTVTRTELGLRTCFFFFFLLISYIKNNINCKKTVWIHFWPYLRTNRYSTATFGCVNESPVSLDGRCERTCLRKCWGRARAPVGIFKGSIFKLCGLQFLQLSPSLSSAPWAFLTHAAEL